MNENRVEFLVAGKPRAQPRARIARHGGMYSAAKSHPIHTYKKVIAMQARLVGPSQPTEGPVAVTLVFVLPRPKRMPGKDRHPHCCKPDIDNLEKAVLDAMQGVFWFDDSQVAVLQSAKFVAAKDESPSVTVCVEW